MLLALAGCGSDSSGFYDACLNVEMTMENEARPVTGGESSCGSGVTADAGRVVDTDYVPPDIELTVSGAQPSPPRLSP